MSTFLDYGERLRAIEPAKRSGRIRRVAGMSFECEGLAAPLGARCEIRPREAPAVRAEVVGFRDDIVILMPLDDVEGIRLGDDVVCLGSSQVVRVGPALLGRVISATGDPLDGRESPAAERSAPLHAKPPDPLGRPRISEPLHTGVRAIDAFVTCGRGQRVGLFAGSGVGKSVLLGMIARNTEADVAVIALVGERGREVREFVERDLGPQGLGRSVVVAETADRPAVLRARAPFTAMAVPTPTPHTMYPTWETMW